MNGTFFTNQAYVTTPGFTDITRKLGVRVSTRFTHRGFTPPQECVEIEREAITTNTMTFADLAVSATNWKPTTIRMTKSTIAELDVVIAHLTAQRERLQESLKEIDAAPDIATA